MKICVVGRAGCAGALLALITANSRAASPEISFIDVQPPPDLFATLEGTFGNGDQVSVWLRTSQVVIARDESSNLSIRTVRLGLFPCSLLDVAPSSSAPIFGVMVCDNSRKSVLSGATYVIDRFPSAPSVTYSLRCATGCTETLPSIFGVVSAYGEYQ